VISFIAFYFRVPRILFEEKLYIPVLDEVRPVLSYWQAANLCPSWSWHEN
jgi:hypothetical protein